MKIQDFTNVIKGLTELISKGDVEKRIFKVLLSIWLVILIIVILLMAILSPGYNIEKKITKTSTGKKLPILGEVEIKEYESLINLAKFPEGIEKYLQGIKYDPFSEYKKSFTIQPTGIAEHDLVIKYIEKIQLPLIYKGYIELPDKIIGQMDWQGKTKFVEVGATLSDYKISSISKEKIEAIDKKGKKIEFWLNKRVFGDELQAVLYDNVSQKYFTVQVTGEIGSYKVIDIAPDYVILLTKEGELKLTK